MSLNTVNHRGSQLATGLTATGNNQATALQLAGLNSLQEFTTVASGTGVILPVAKLPASVTIANAGTNVLSVYPQVGGTINNGTVNAAVTISAGSTETFEASSLTNWYSLGGSAGSVSSVTFTGDGVVLSSTPSSAVTTTGTLAAALAAQTENTVLAGPTSGSAAAPTFRAIGMSDLPTIGTMDVYGNSTGGTAAPVGVGFSVMIDAAIGNTQGDLLYRGASAWSVLAPGTSGNVLATQGASANPHWIANTAGMTALTGDVTARGSGSQAAMLYGQTNVITPTVTATTNNWNPSGLSTANVIRFTNSTVYCDLTGITAPASDGAILTLENSASSTFPIALRNANANSAAANRFAFSSDIFLAPGESIALKYSADNSRWKELNPHKSYDANLWGCGQDGNVTLGSGTLTRNMYYRNLTVPASVALNTAGYRIYVSEMLDISAASAGSFVNNGSAANAGSALAGGGASGAQGGTAIGGGQAGTAGGTGTSTNGGNGTSGTAAVGNGGGGGAGGTGGAGSGGTHGSGGGGSGTPTFFPFYGPTNSFLNQATLTKGGLGGSGGGAGSGDSTNAGGGGGGGSSGGSSIAIDARFINRGTNSTAAIFQAKSLTGGAGAAGVGGTAGGGAGGASGGGGWVQITYGYLLGSTITGAIDVSSGAGGAGGNGASTGPGGNGGGNGAYGATFLVNATTGACTVTTIGSAAAGNAASGSTGGTGAAAGTQQVNL